jgi:hypothetical protein
VVVDVIVAWIGLEIRRYGLRLRLLLLLLRMLLLLLRMLLTAPYAGSHYAA